MLLVAIGGGVGLLAGLRLLATLSGRSAGDLLAEAIVLAVALSAAIVGWRKLAPYRAASAAYEAAVQFNVDNRRIELPLVLLHELGPEIAGQVSSRVDLRRTTLTEPASQQKVGEGKTKRAFSHPWLAMKLRLVDGTRVQLTATLRLQEVIKATSKRKKHGVVTRYRNRGRFEERFVVVLRRAEGQPLRTPQRVLAALQRIGAPVTGVDAVPDGVRVRFQHCTGSFKHAFAPSGPSDRLLEGDAWVPLEGEADLLDASMCLRMLTAAFVAATGRKPQPADDAAVPQPPQ